MGRAVVPCTVWAIGMQGYKKENIKTVVASPSKGPWWYVYLLVWPCGTKETCYVGCSTNPHKRFIRHRNDPKSACYQGAVCDPCLTQHQPM